MPLLSADLAYVGLLASRRRASAVFDALAARGISPEQLARVRAPAGLDIGARTPGDVAIAILAEIIATAASVPETVRTDTVPIDPSATPSAPNVMPSPSVMLSLSKQGPETPPTARDPICGMEVAIPGAQFTLDIDSVRSYFCCAECRAAYAAERRRAVTTGGPA